MFKNNLYTYVLLLTRDLFLDVCIYSRTTLVKSVKNVMSVYETRCKSNKTVSEHDIHTLVPAVEVARDVCYIISTEYKLQHASLYCRKLQR